MLNKKNIIQINSLHANSSSSCSYCSSERKSDKKWVTTGFSCDNVTARDYEDLMNRGWRRCGTYYYTTNLDKCCCRAYSIRLDAQKNTLRYSQKKVLKKIEKFLNNDETGEKIEDEVEEKAVDKNKSAAGGNMNNKNPDQLERVQSIVDDFSKALRELSKEFLIMLEIVPEEDLKDPVMNDVKVLTVNGKKKLGTFSCNILMQFYWINVKLFEKFNCDIGKFVEKTKEMVIEQFKKLEPSLDYMITNIGTIYFLTDKDKEKIEKAKGNMDFEGSPMKVEKHEPQEESKEGEQKPIKEKKPKKEAAKNMQQNSLKPQDIPLPKKKTLEVRLEPAKFDNELFELYSKYCKEIHGSKKESANGFKNFLCLQALEPETERGPNNEKLEYGCFHMKYYLDGKLIGVGVIDITPRVLSSVYFFYDPEYKKLSLGVYAALKEIEFVKEKQKHFPDFQYYYLGFYIHRCKKMNYKADYEPSELLCPSTYKWVSFDKNIVSLLGDELPSARLAPQAEKKLPDMDFESVNIANWVNDKIKIFAGGNKIIKLPQINPSYVALLTETFKNLVCSLGKCLAQNFIYG